MRYTIIGAAKSGLSAARLARKNGHEVFVSESKPENAFDKEIAIFKELGISYEFGGNSHKALDKAECVISSPGVPPHSQLIVEAEKLGLPIISELEFARSFMPDQKIIAITGTNGKTTTTTLIHYILQRAGKTAYTAGNIGTPLSDLVGVADKDAIIVAELSSFQLDRIKNFRPDVGILLNVTPDHLYYHHTFDNYREAKFKICMNQIEKDFLILNVDDPECSSKFAHTKGNILYFSMNPIDGYGIYQQGGKMYARLPNMQKEEEVMLLEDIKLPGAHNAYNSMAAALAARVFEIRNENIRDSLMAFEGVEHRLEFVRTLDGVDYVNDSKATNVNATWYALSSYKKPIVWIAGGRGDNNDYAALDELVKANVKTIVAVGEEADSIFNHFCAMTRCVKADSMEDAVKLAREYAEADEIALFTPACKSFDMFLNFEHRGEVFKEIVNSLK
jgi:UDP-N-acetylmuramoylalanine--D-glutamate ligase